MMTDNELIIALLEKESIKDTDLLISYLNFKPKETIKNFRVAIYRLLEKEIIDYTLVATQKGIEKYFFICTKIRLHESKKFKIEI